MPIRLLNELKISKFLIYILFGLYFFQKQKKFFQFYNFKNFQTSNSIFRFIILKLLSNSKVFFIYHYLVFFIILFRVKRLDTIFFQLFYTHFYKGSKVFYQFIPQFSFISLFSRFKCFLFMLNSKLFSKKHIIITY